MYATLTDWPAVVKLALFCFSLVLLTNKFVNPTVVISAVLDDITAVCLCCKPIYPVPVVALTSIKSVGICKNVGTEFLL